MTFKLGSYKTANSLLKAVLKLFTNERARWIKDDFEEEKTIKGKLTTCFCLAGAIQKGAATDAVKNEAFAKIVCCRRSIAAQRSIATPVRKISGTSPRTTMSRDVESMTSSARLSWQ